MMTVKVASSHGLMPFGWMLTAQSMLVKLSFLLFRCYNTHPNVHSVIVVVRSSTICFTENYFARDSMTATVISQNRYGACKLDLDFRLKYFVVYSQCTNFMYVVIYMIYLIF